MSGTLLIAAHRPQVQPWQYQSHTDFLREQLQLSHDVDLQLGIAHQWDIASIRRHLGRTCNRRMRIHVAAWLRAQLSAWLPDEDAPIWLALDFEILAIFDKCQDFLRRRSPAITSALNVLQRYSETVERRRVRWRQVFARARALALAEEELLGDPDVEHVEDF